MAIDKVQYKDFGTCCRISNGKVEVLVTEDIGPRIIAYRYVNGENAFGEIGPEVINETELGKWRPRGGHRLWHAPEVKPRSYSPDNDPITIEKLSDFSVKTIQPVEEKTGIEKQMVITLDSESSRVTVEHRLTNKNLWPVELAPWALSIMHPCGTTIIPQEPFVPHTDKLLPARPLVMWGYTNMNDPRWKWGEKFITLKCDPAYDYPQKLGVGNKQEWAGYLVDGLLFVKRFPYDETKTYPDYGCNFETFTNGDFMEVETVSYLRTVAPNETATHVENWFLFKDVAPVKDDASIDEVIMPLVNTTNI